MTKYLLDNQDLTFEKGGFLTFVVNSSLSFKCQLNNGDYHLLIFFDNIDDIEYKENIILNMANAHITYVELNDKCLNQHSTVILNKDCEVNIYTTYLGIKNKDIIFDINHAGSNSNSLIRNNVVCFDKSHFSMDVIGSIDKGSKNSACHQKSHCLTIGNPKMARILPVLNIDENDVEASHSLSCGTIDDEIMFYMNARGLSKKDALQLLLVSYLMPNEEFYNDYEGGQEIHLKATGKAEKVCSM